MLSVLADGENRHRLKNEDGEQIGWIRGRAIGFMGLPDEEAARRAAAAGARALRLSLRQVYPGWPQYEPSLEQLRIVHDGAYEWVSDGRVPLARLLRTRSEGSDPALFGVEFQLPSFASEGIAILAAQALGRALAEHLTPARPAPATGGPGRTATEWHPDDAA